MTSHARAAEKTCWERFMVGELTNDPSYIMNRASAETLEKIARRAEAEAERLRAIAKYRSR
jgi:hypothetical protein